MYNARIRSEKGDEDRSNFLVSISELDGEGGKDIAKVPAVFEIA